ncbi:Signal transduction histidine-protein kinase/phosphatase UhpB [Gallionellaceae bacterium]|nr:Signal transduction histidine-protein kinase/phosphatase UhpB [Gallionellaceae bacterium]
MLPSALTGVFFSQLQLPTGNDLTHRYGKRRFDDADSRSKAELLDELALNKEVSEKSTAHLLRELQVHQIELEMQNRELREAQQTLEEMRDRYARLYDFAPVGYLTLDDAGRVLEINLTGAAMLGLERENIVGKSFGARLANGDIHAFFHHLRQVFRAPGNVVTELRIMGRDGEVNYVRLESAAVLSEARACRTVMTNITEQKRMALALQQTRTEQEALLGAIPAIVYYKDMNLRYVTVSQVFAGFLGRPVEDVLGKTDFELLPHELAEDFQRISLEVLESGEFRAGMENRIMDANGNTVYLSTVLAPFYNPAGNIAGLLGVGIDVSRLKKAASLNQELMLQNRTLTQNLYSIQESERRHLARELHDELGQWLTAIHAEAQAIGGMLDDKEHKIAASVQAISESASEMHRVIRGMLRQLRPALLDELGLADSLRELVNQWHLHHGGIACELVLEGDLDGFGENTNITAYRIIQEALSNIAKYAEADQVSVQLRREAGETQDSDAMLLCVEDNGKGFDPDHVSKGLGLLGMRERAIAAGGEFFLFNTPGLGVRIDVRLPLNYQIERRRK